MVFLLLDQFFESDTPLSLEPRYIRVIWIIILCLQGAFTLSPLIFNAGDFYEILTDKIWINFALVWISITLSSVIPTVDTHIGITIMSPVLFVLMKIYSHYFIYHQIKYHDEGNAFVSRLEFFTLHVTFSMIEAWITYLMLFSAFQVLVQYLNSRGEIEEAEKNEYIQSLGVLAMVVILWEMAYNLAYYKDVIFSIFCFGIFVGIWFRNRFGRAGDRTAMAQKSSLGWAIISLIFTIITTIHSSKSAFYLKYFAINRKLKNIEDAMIQNDQEIEHRNQY